MGPFRRFALKSSVVAGLSIAALAATVTPAAAYTPYAYGYPGGVDATRIAARTLDSTTGSFAFLSRYVSKSPQYAGYQQQVCVTYNIVFANPQSTSWSQAASSRTCGWLTSNTTLLIPGHAEQLWRTWIYAGNVRVDWYLANGAWIGTRILDYNAVGDYNCLYCTVAWSSALGAYVRF